MARGNIRNSPGKGKKITTFTYDVDQEVDGRVETRKVEIIVYLQSRYDEGSEPPKATLATQFRLEAGEEVEYGTDLDACLKAMRGKLDAAYRIRWERWLLVKVEPRMVFSRMGYGLELSWQDVERGETLDGDVLMREPNASNDFHSPWRISPWPEVYKDARGRTVACVRATEENEAALDAFRDKLRELTKTLADFVSPDNIEETLAMIAGGQLKLLGRESS